MELGDAKVELLYTEKHQESLGFPAGSLLLPQWLEYSSDFKGKKTWRVWAWQMVAGHTC